MIGKEISDTLYGLALLVNALLFIPQAWRIYKHKSANEASLITFGGFNVIQCLGLVDGIYNQDYGLVYGQLISILACGSVTLQIIIIKIKQYRLKSKHNA